MSGVAEQPIKGTVTRDVKSRRSDFPGLRTTFWPRGALKRGGGEVVRDSGLIRRALSDRGKGAEPLGFEVLGQGLEALRLCLKGSQHQGGTERTLCRMPPT